MPRLELEPPGWDGESSLPTVDVCRECALNCPLDGMIDNHEPDDGPSYNFYSIVTVDAEHPPYAGGLLRYVCDICKKILTAEDD